MCSTHVQSVYHKRQEGNRDDNRLYCQFDNYSNLGRWSEKELSSYRAVCTTPPEPYWWQQFNSASFDTSTDAVIYQTSSKKEKSTTQVHQARQHIKKLLKKTLWPLFMDGGSTASSRLEPLQGGRFTFYQPVDLCTRLLDYGNPAP